MALLPNKTYHLNMPASDGAAESFARCCCCSAVVLLIALGAAAGGGDLTIPNSPSLPDPGNKGATACDSPQLTILRAPPSSSTFIHGAIVKRRAGANTKLHHKARLMT
jgi:hypothetical protein